MITRHADASSGFPWRLSKVFPMKTSAKPRCLKYLVNVHCFLPGVCAESVGVLCGSSGVDPEDDAASLKNGLFNSPSIHNLMRPMLISSIRKHNIFLSSDITYTNIHDMRYTTFDEAAPGGSYGDWGRKAVFTTCSNQVASMLFSERNLERVNGMLRTIIKKKYGYTIGRQSFDELAIVLRSMYEMHGNPGASDPAAEVQKLNARAMEFLIPHVKANIESYFAYIRDSTRPYRLLDRPTNTSLRGQNVMYNSTLD